MKLYDNDAEILALAFADGCRERLLAARSKVNASAFLVGWRAYIVHTADGDSGFSCVEAETPIEQLGLIPLVREVLGPIDSINLAPSENVPTGPAH